MKRTDPLVSIVILNFNGLEDSINCINSLTSTKYSNFEVILIDNGSYVNEAALIDETFNKFNKLKCFRLKVNKGFTGGNNWGLKKTTGKYIVLLNNDTEVEKNWLGPLVEYLEKKRKVAVIQPKIKLLKNKKYFDYAGAAGGFIDKYGFPFTRGRLFETIEKDEGQYDGESDIFWASGAACIIRRSVIKKVGGLFSENLFNYMEEIDFCWRVWRAGYSVKFLSDSVVYHKVAATSKNNLFKKRFWEHRNNLFIITRNLPRKAFYRIIPFRFALEIATYIYYLFSKQHVYFGSLLLAHLDYIKKLLYIKKERNHKIKMWSNGPIYPGSVVLDYFLKKRKTFHELNWSPKGNVSYILFNADSNTGGNVVIKHLIDFKKKGYGVRLYYMLGKQRRKLSKDVNGKNFVFSFMDITPDVLVATFWPTAFLLKIMRGKRKYLFSQDWGVDMHDFFLFRLLAKYAYVLTKKHIVISKYLKRKIIEVNASADIKKIKYYTLDRSVFNTDDLNKVLKIKFGNIKKSKIRVVSVVSWYAHCKGPDVLVKTVKKLKILNENFHFTLVSREKYPYKNVFDRFVSNPKPNVISEIYKKSHVLLATSRSEGFFIPGLEAMACASVFFTTDSGGIKEYAINDHNSVIVKKVDSLWENNLILECLINKRKINKLITNGLSVSESYDGLMITKDLEKLYFPKENQFRNEVFKQ